MMVIDNIYNNGQLVYLITDKDQSARMITGILVSTAGIMYRLACGTVDTFHYENEISPEKDYCLTTTN